MSKKLGEGIIRLNEDADKRSVLDSIDRPIRPLVLELHRVGFRTAFSCCGFTYEGEEEPKSHHKLYTYVVIYGPHANDPEEVRRFFTLADWAGRDGWLVSLMTPGDRPEVQEWHVGYQAKDIPWEDNDEGESIHRYEGRLCAIQRMVNYLKTWPSVKGSVQIVDGNIGRKAFAPDWQVHPKQTYTVAQFE